MFCPAISKTKVDGSLVQLCPLAYPLPAEHPEDDHEAVHEVREVPPGHRLVREPLDII